MDALKKAAIEQKLKWSKIALLGTRVLTFTLIAGIIIFMLVQSKFDRNSMPLLLIALVLIPVLGIVLPNFIFRPIIKECQEVLKNE